MSRGDELNRLPPPLTGGPVIDILRSRLVRRRFDRFSRYSEKLVAMRLRASRTISPTRRRRELERASS